MTTDRTTPSTEAQFDATKVDIVALAPDRVSVELIVVADGTWTGSDAQVMSLRHKIHSYVSFALDGQLVATHPDVAGLPWRIVIALLGGPPDPTTAAVIADVREAVKRHGGELETREH